MTNLDAEAIDAPHGSATRRYRRAASSLLLAALALAILGGAVLIGTARNAETAARERATVTRALIAQLREVRAQILNAETGQRGYLLTGDASYLEPYNEGVTEVPVALDYVEEHLRPIAVPSQAEALDTLKALIDEKREVMRETIRLARDGQTTRALAIVEEDRGARLMESIRKVIASLERDEEQLLDAAVARAIEAEDRSRIGFYGLSACALGLFVTGVWLNRKARADEEELHKAEANELLARELNHRIKNLFAVVGAIVSLSSRGVKTPEEAAARARERILALGRAHEASQNSLGSDTVDLRKLVQSVLEPYDASGEYIEVQGPSAMLPTGFIMPMGLLMHEWATNAVKYGALSAQPGRLLVNWDQRSDNTIVLSWTESGGPGVAGPPEFKGFGTRMVDQSVRQMNAELKTEWHGTGVMRTISLPATEAAGTL